MSAIQRCKNNRNWLIIAIVVKLERLCCCQIVPALRMAQLPTMSAKQWYDFHHNSMRPRWIFDVFDYLDRPHFELQYETLIVSFTYWVQMLLRCEISEVAKQWRARGMPSFAILSDLALTLKSCTEFFWKNSRANLYLLNKIWPISRFLRWNRRVPCVKKILP